MLEGFNHKYALSVSKRALIVLFKSRGDFGWEDLVIRLTLKLFHRSAEALHSGVVGVTVTPMQIFDRSQTGTRLDKLLEPLNTLPDPLFGQPPLGDVRQHADHSFGRAVAGEFETPGKIQPSRRAVFAMDAENCANRASRLDSVVKRPLKREDIVRVHILL